MLLNQTINLKAGDFQKTADVGSGILVENLEECLGAFLKSLDYASSRGLFSLHGVINFLVLCFCIAVAYILGRTAGHKEEKHSGDLLKQFFIMSVLFNFLFYGFTENRLLITRYVIPTISGVIPALAICFAQEKDHLKRRLCFLVAALFFAGGGLRTYYSLAVNDYNEDRYASIAFLKDNNLNFGYATSWNAGVVMELTDGEIEVVNMHDIENQLPQLQTCSKRWFTEEYEGTPFLLLTKEEYELYRDSEVVVKGDLVYEDDAFLILLYEDKQDICSYEL